VEGSGAVLSDVTGERSFFVDLQEFFRENKKVALAFSGGVDSSYLFYAAAKYGAKIRAYYVKSAFQPQFELEDAKRLAGELGADMQVLSIDVLGNPIVAGNPADRCYHCKKVIFAAVAKAAAEDKYPVLVDGTNASDDAGDRPGMRVLLELSVRSPLRECGLTKEDIRRLSKEAGLFTWDKPAYACLATRVPAGERITAEKLQKTEAAESYLHSAGLTDFRVRFFGNAARLQVPAEQLAVVLGKRREIIHELKKYYSAVLLDLEVRE